MIENPERNWWIKGIGVELLQLFILTGIGIYACLTLKQIREDIAEFHTAACTRLEVIKNLAALSAQKDIDESQGE